MANGQAWSSAPSKIVSALAHSGHFWNSDRRKRTGETMTKALKHAARAGTKARLLDWRKRMSDNIAYALLVYTGMQIFVTVQALKLEGMSILPYLALVVLVAAIIPACRAFERRGRGSRARPRLPP